MNLINLIANKPQIVSQIASLLGLNQEQTQSAINPLLGSITVA